MRAKNIITRLILNTDMSLHTKNLDKLKNLTRNHEFDPKRNQEHKWVVFYLYSSSWNKFFMDVISEIPALNSATTSAGTPFWYANSLSKFS